MGAHRKTRTSPVARLSVATGAVYAHVYDTVAPTVKRYAVVIALAAIAVLAMNDQPYAEQPEQPANVPGMFNPSAPLDGTQVRDCRMVSDMEICKDPNYHAGDDTEHGA